MVCTGLIWPLLTISKHYSHEPDPFNLRKSLFNDIDVLFNFCCLAVADYLSINPWNHRIHFSIFGPVRRRRQPCRARQNLCFRGIVRLFIDEQTWIWIDETQPASVFDIAFNCHGLGRVTRDNKDNEWHKAIFFNNLCFKDTGLKYRSQINICGCWNLQLLLIPT